MESPEKKTAAKESFSFKKRLKSFQYAGNGIEYMFRREHNFRIHVVIALLVVIAGIWLSISTTEWLIIIICFGMVLAAETFNSSIEKLTDIASPEVNPEAGLVKDLAAGAVLILAIAAAIIGLIIFIPKIIAII